MLLTSTPKHNPMKLINLFSNLECHSHASMYFHVCAHKYKEGIYNRLDVAKANTISNEPPLAGVLAL